MKLALAKSDRRYGGVRVDDEGLVDRALLAKSDSPKSPASLVVAAVDRPGDPPRTDIPTIAQFVPMADSNRTPRTSYPGSRSWRSRRFLSRLVQNVWPELPRLGAGEPVPEGWRTACWFGNCRAPRAWRRHRRRYGR
jgi:hypothetical protein